MLGQVLDGRYRMDRRVARGGMATVYAGLDLRLDRAVAVKVMHGALAEDEQFVARFIREAKSAARLSSPDVVSVFDQGADGGHVYLVMELVHGRTLREVLREQGPLTPAEAVAVLEPVLAALGAAHRAGLVHRDVKPENVLVADDGRVKVADFGLARALQASSSTSSSGLLLGTVAYLAPEQVETGRSDTRSDVYAAGILLVEMLTGAPPYTGETPISVAFRHVHEDVPAPSELVPDVPDDLDALAVRATRRDPRARPADADEFLAALRRVRRSLEAAGEEVALRLPAGAATAGPGGPTQALPPVQGLGARADGGDGDTDAGPGSPAQPTLVGVPRPAGGPGAAQRRRARLLLTVSTLLAVVAAVAGWWFAAGRLVDAPDLLGLAEPAAAQQASAAGLGIEVGAPAHSEDVPAGQVLRQDPGPGEGVPRGGDVEVSLSLGPERFAVPGVAGQPLDAARDALARASLEVGAVREAYDEEVPEGSIVTTDPPAETELRRGAAVSLVVSRGPEPVPVPAVAGEDADAAGEALEEAGFRVRVTEAFDEEVARGRAVRTEPASGETARRGDTVTLVVSRGPELVGVPDLAGTDGDAAVRRLEALGLTARRVDVPGGDGEVLSQQPAAGKQVRKRTPVTVYVY
jgi:beta-lactam-binding protein with PASTA domain